LKLGKFEIEFFHINHSVPDGVAIVVKTPYGAIVHSSDFKFDYNPSDDQPIDLARIAQIGKQGVALAMLDSTSVLKEGHTISESVVEETVANEIKQAKGRVIIATFSSNIGRISKIIETAEAEGRTVFLSGRSMERNIGIARKLNYLKCKDKTLQRMSRKANSMDPRKVMILSTGSQGEELAALTRMSAGTHRDIKLVPEDLIIFSSSPIPGNVLAIVSVLNNLAEIGCKKIDHRDSDLHVSGHAHKEECKLMTSLLNPKFIAPIHGEIFMRYGHKKIMEESLQIKPENGFIMKNGQGVVLSQKGVRLMTDKEALAGKETLVQLGEKIHDKIIENRSLMSQNGIIMIIIKADADKISKLEVKAQGFIYRDQNHEIFKMIKKEVEKVWTRNYDPARPESQLANPIKQSVERIFLQRFRQDQLVDITIL
jgi:ribonuclease J